MNKEEFCERIALLRMNKGVSARDMSLSIGQSAGYMNNIENGVNLPSMTIFFYICEYLEITPQEFFDLDMQNPVKYHELIEAARHLTTEQLDILTALAKMLRKKD